MTKYQKWIIGIVVTVVALGLFALGVYIAALCKDLTWIEMFKQMFGIAQKVVEDTSGTGTDTGTEVVQALRLFM